LAEWAGFILTPLLNLVSPPYRTTTTMGKRTGRWQGKSHPAGQMCLSYQWSDIHPCRSLNIRHSIRYPARSSQRGSAPQCWTWDRAATYSWGREINCKILWGSGLPGTHTARKDGQGMCDISHTPTTSPPMGQRLHYLLSKPWSWNY
jgi:hypothetical protein